MDLLQYVLPTLMVFAPVLGYIPQYQDIQKSGNPRGFSTLVCFILLVSNIIRVFYWFGERFETFLLLQSPVMIVAQITLLQLCVGLRRKAGISSRSNSLADLGSFWNWPYISTYFQFVALIIVSLSISTFLFVNQQWYVQFVGTLALGIEATLGLPQAYSNWKTKNTEGLNLVLIGSWFAGDSLKTIVFLTERAPLQFIGCGLFQLFVDCVVLAQLAMYRRSK